MHRSKKSLAIITMVHGDHHWARLWKQHYSAQVESDRDIYVILHGDDPVLEEIFRGCSVLHVPYDDNGPVNFESRRLDMKHMLIKSLQAYFQCVLLVDIDELVVVAPEHHQPLHTYLAHVHNGEIVRSALGLEVMEHPGETCAPLDLSKPLFTQRQWVYCNAQYCKPCAFYYEFGLASHHRVWGAPWIIDQNLLLFHLRYADRTLRETYFQTRKSDFQKQSAAGTPSSRSWRAPVREYQSIIKDIQSREEGVLNAETRRLVRNTVLKHFVRTDRLGNVSSGFLHLPEDYRDLIG